MSWSQILNDVNARLNAVSQNFSNLDPSYRPSTTNDAASNSTPFDGAMSVRVHLDQRDVPFYTNLDFVTGKVILNLMVDTTIAGIKVKLEGEAKTRLLGPRYPNDLRSDRNKMRLEVHKLLYKVQTLFPTPEIALNALNAQFTLPAGQYSYPFSFKIPINSDCISNTTLYRDMKLGPFLGPDITNARHVKQTLPPGLGGFPGEAEIVYFVKATVVRPKFYQENMRQQVDIKFLPIESPRPATTSEETFARRQHQFQPSSGTLKKTSIFKKATEASSKEPALGFKVEARLPSPAIITCHQPLPLKLMVEKTNDSPANLYLGMLQIELIGFTDVRAQDLARTETGSWIIMSQANINLPLENLSDKSSGNIKIPSRFWENIPLPNTVAPSFETCNLSRRYELEVRIGISHGMADGIRPELAVLPLRLPVQVYSGVAPPQQLLNRMNTKPTSGATLTPVKPHIPHQAASPITPVQYHGPPQTGSYVSPPQDDPHDLPPSYEDAMAEDIAPVDGPRRDFNTSGPPNSTSATYNPDVKSESGLNRHPSERLFSQNAPAPPGRGAGRNSRRSSQQGTVEQQTNPLNTTDLPDLIEGLDVNDNPNTPVHKATQSHSEKKSEKN